MGRLVQTHSTYVDGLINVLKELKKDQKIKTMTPGVIGKVKGHEEYLKIKVTRTVIGGFKMIARKGKSAQELYILTDYKKETLENKIKDCIQQNR